MEREPYAKGGAALQLALYADAAAMPLNDPFDESKPKSSSSIFSREIGLEDLLYIPRLDSTAGIGYRHFHPFVFTSETYSQLAPRRHRLLSVQHKIGKTASEP